MQLRLDAGRPMLALEGHRLVAGGELRRALFEVVEGQAVVDVAGGALAYRERSLRLRAIELALPLDTAAAAGPLRTAGLQVLRDRPRAGGLDLLLLVDGPPGTAAAPARARIAVAPDDDGMLLLVDEVIGLPALPRDRLEIAAAILAGLPLPGAGAVRALVRRATPVTAVLDELLAQHGWRAPVCVGVKVRDLSLARGECVLRAWSGALPDGWRPAKEPRRTVAAAVGALKDFAMLVADANGDVARRRTVEAHLRRDAAGTPHAPAVVPFMVDLLARTGAAPATLEPLLAAALAEDDQHLGVLSAAAGLAGLTATERAARLQRLAAAADADDDPWVAARTGIAAALVAEADGDLPTALAAAAAAVDADPTLAEASREHARLLSKSGDGVRALAVGRAALDRAGHGSVVDSAADFEATDRFAVQLAAIAREVESVDAARALLHRALRHHERVDALQALALLEATAGDTVAARAAVDRLRAVATEVPAVRVEVELLSAHLAELAGDAPAARSFLHAAHALAPTDARVAHKVAQQLETEGALDAAVATLAPVVDAWLAGTHDADTHNAARTAARLLVLRAQRAGGGDDAVRARCVLTRLVAAAPGDATLARLDAEARAALGDGRPLATVLLAEAAAVNDTGEAAGRRARAGALLAAAGDHADACDAWQAAWDQLEPGPARDVVNIAAWFLAARSAVDPVRLGALIARTGLDGLDLATVASSVLREAVIHVSEVTRQRAVLRVLAGRDEDPDDVQRWLDACRALPPAEAAAAYCTAARARANAAWLLEALQLLQSAGEPRQALDAALDALDAHEAFAAERAVLAAAFELAVAVDDPAQIDARAEALAAHGEPEDRRHVLRTRSQSHQHLVGDADRRARYRASLQAWVQAFPTDREALEPLVGLLLDHGELEGAVAVLDRACAAGAGAALHLLLSKTAAAARAGSGAVELRAHELLLGLPLASDVRARVEHRLVEVYVREGRPERAGALLSSQATRDELDDDARVALWLRAAQIHESGQQLTEAIAALERAVSARPDDGGLSERLRTLCRAARDDHALARECARRAARLPPGPERSALLVEVGDVARSAARLDDARRAWLAATRRAFSAEAWARLEELATQTGSARLVVRGNLAVARAWGSTAPADAVAHIAAAATCLARDLGRSGLAIRVLEAGERFAAAQGVDDRQFALPLVDLLQAAGDGAGARARLDGLVERAAGSARARLLERRAVVAAALLGDDDAAINDRRAALWFDPTAAESARALARQLRARGDARGAIDVERALIDATLEGTERAAAYGALAAVAARDLGDDGATVTDDLCEAALRGGARLDVMRLQLAARERLGDPARLRTTLALLSRQALPADEQRAVAGRLADLCETDGAYGEAADALLRVEEAGPSNLVASDDQRTARLLGLLDRAGRLVEAADAVLRALKAWPEGSPLLGTRATLLLRAARWLDDGDRARAADALGLLGQAASLTRLDDEDEQRRATLAERQERPDIAIAALEQLVTRGVDVEHTALRLAAAAEAWGEPERALTAWQLRASRIPDDLLAWRAVERLAAATGDPAALQGARERLVTLADGAADEQAARALACARDARDRLGDVTAALAWLDRARALAASPTIRRESLVMAVAADDATAELTVLDEMVAAADPLSVEERTRRASLRLAAADSTAAFQTILDDAQFVIAAGATPAAVTAITAVLTAVTRRSPDVVVATLLAHPSAALRDAVVSAMPTLPPGALDDEAIVSLADRFPEAPSFARAAARREQASGQLIAAADRLLAVAVRHAHDADLVRATVDEAAAIVCDTGATALADRLEDLRPALRRHSTLRAAAVDALGHDGRWESVALLLDDALVLTDSRAERRALRLQLAAVLHHGLTTAPALLRAADHLDALVADDPEDVEAWDALLACLERSGDHDRLQAALAERAAMAQGPLRRMLVVRRGTLLLALDRGHEALDALRATRRDGDDHEQKDLERRIHAAVDARDADAALRDGGPATARFLDNELTRQPDVDDARALLALPPGAVPPGARVRARLALLVLLDGESAESHARNLLAPGGGLDALARADEAVAVLDGAARSNDSRVRGRAKGLAAAVARTASVIGSRAALRLADGLRALDDEVQSTLTIDEAFGGATAARRWRLHGPRAVEADGAFLTGRAGAALGFRRAARLADRETLHRMARSLGVDVASVGSGEAARASLQASAQQQQHTVARGVAGDLTLLRLGDRRGAARVAARSADARASVTRRARVMPLTVRRLEARLELARLVDQPVDDVLVELGAIAAVAQANASAIERRALDAAFAVRAPGSHALVRRAELACANDDVDAVDWCERAADAAEGLAELEEAATRLRRHAIAARLQQNQRDALGRQLRAFARSGGRHGGPAMDARRAEALSVAEAAGMLDVVDGIMADAVEGTASVEERVGAVRRRAQLRLTVRQPREAFRVLVDGAALAGPFAGPLRDEAYALAASEALIDDMLEVVDDDLARAGLLAVVGRRAEATALAATLDDPAALWLLADCAQRAGDPAAEERALANLAARGLADDALSQRLVDAAAARGAADEAARRALGRLASATVDPARLQAAVVRLQDVPAAERSSVARALLDLAADARRRGVVAAGVERLFAAARSVADQLAPVDD
ncbi:MAG: hypothetical protein FJ137_12620, partial [Deltaproteobacteria bacterium]|nr:hypothetical protein [Deltaproteobacteria bacterium]